MKIITSSFLALWMTVGIGQTQLTKEMEIALDSIINPLVQTENYNGTVLVMKDGRHLWSGSYGWASREFDVAHDIDSKFFLASVSMIFTATAVMQLVEDGKVALNQKVSAYLPEYIHGNKITIHDLMAQRSGIPAIGSQGDTDYNRMTKFKHNASELYEYFKEYPLSFKPGERYNHGRSEYVLLALIIEKVSGKPFGDFLNDIIFTPLGMDNTGHYSGDDLYVKKLSKGYAPAGIFGIEPAYHLDWSSKTGHASIFSTVGDLAKFGQAVLENRLLNRDSWDVIFTDHGSQVGYGWFIRPHLNRTRYQMNGRSPGFSSYLAIYPDEELIITVLSNIYISLPASMGMQIASVVLNEPYTPLPLSKEKLRDTDAKAFIGSYQFGPNFYRPNYLLDVHLKDGYLTTEWGSLIPVDRGERPIKEYKIRTFWSDIVFIKPRGDVKYEMHFDEFVGKRQ